MKTVLEILENMPTKKVKCSWCGGQGFHITGAISTKTCKECGGSGKKSVPNYDEAERQIRKVILKEYELLHKAAHEVWGVELINLFKEVNDEKV